MSIRPLCLYLSLLACLGPALSASPVSSFPIDAANLAERICDDDPAERTKVKCHAIVKNFDTELAISDSSLRLVSDAPVVTPCGLWNATLTFDPVRARLRFANQETGQTVDFTLRPGRGAGRWSLVRVGRSPYPVGLIGESDEEEEVLTFDDCIPSWVYDDPTLEVVPEEGCEVCPEDGGEAPPPDDEETPSSDDDSDQSQEAPAEPQP